MDIDFDFIIGMLAGTMCTLFGAYVSYKVNIYRYKRYVARQQIPKT